MLFIKEGEEHQWCLLHPEQTPWDFRGLCVCVFSLISVISQELSYTQLDLINTLREDFFLLLYLLFVKHWRCFCRLFITDLNKKCVQCGWKKLDIFYYVHVRSVPGTNACSLEGKAVLVMTLCMSLCIVMKAKTKLFWYNIMICTSYNL